METQMKLRIGLVTLFAKLIGIGIKIRETTLRPEFALTPLCSGEATPPQRPVL